MRVIKFAHIAGRRHDWVDGGWVPSGPPVDQVVLEKAREAGNKVRLRAKDLVKGGLGILAAASGGEQVSETRRKVRLLICSECEYLGLRGEEPACSLCKCKLKDKSGVLSLVALEETEKYKCPYPGGSRWKKAGV